MVYNSDVVQRAQNEHFWLPSQRVLLGGDCTNDTLGGGGAGRERVSHHIVCSTPVSCPQSRH